MKRIKKFYVILSVLVLFIIVGISSLSSDASMGIGPIINESEPTYEPVVTTVPTYEPVTTQCPSYNPVPVVTSEPLDPIYTSIPTEEPVEETNIPASTEEPVEVTNMPVSTEEVVDNNIEIEENKEEAKKDENKKDLDVSPKTADSYNIGICILLAVMAGITAMGIYIRRKNRY